jgi:hypothetical protein
MKADREEIVKALVEMSERHPDWRFGQMVANIAYWALGPSSEAILDVEDKQLLGAVKKHLARKPRKA